MSNSFNGLETIRHSAAHIMAAAAQKLFPEIKFGIGPVIEHGFYYDFDLSHTLTPEDLKKIEKEMHKLIKDDVKFVREEMPVDEAVKLFKNLKQDYKVELLYDLKEKGTTQIDKQAGTSRGPAPADPSVSVYRAGDFVDLCRGPHVKSAKEIKSFKLMSIAGAYWRGDEKNKMLQRIYAVAFETEKELVDHLKFLEEARKRDHRKLGKELELFVFSDLVGTGLPLYTFNGARVRRKIIEYSNELQSKIGYREVHTPQINKAQLFKISGHYDKYKDDMFLVKSNYTDEEYFLKPMNCPQHTQLYASQMRSYKDLPLRIADFSMLYRDEKPGELSGLTRLRAFSQDDGHCFCREEQIKDEFSAVLKIINEAMKTYKMDYWISLSLRDPQQKGKYLGDDKVWEKSQKLLEELLIEHKMEYKTVEGEAAFYGPKMDLIAADSLGREFQISTIQLDFNMPKNFGLKYVGQDGKEYTPVMIHRAIIGSPDRFLGILIEHYAGAFPVWLAPVQVKILPVSDKFLDYGRSLLSYLKDDGIQTELDDRNESLGKKIREAEKNKVPYMLIVGEKEQAENKVAVRRRGEGDIGAMKKEEFAGRVKEEIRKRI